MNKDRNTRPFTSAWRVSETRGYERSRAGRPRSSPQGAAPDSSESFAGSDHGARLGKIVSLGYA